MKLDHWKNNRSIRSYQGLMVQHSNKLKQWLINRLKEWLIDYLHISSSLAAKKNPRQTPAQASSDLNG